MTWWIILYTIFLTISIAITFWVGHNLHRWGSAFLVDIFEHEPFAESINNLLLVGYYLVNLAYSLFILKSSDTIDSVAGLFEIASVKIGFIITVLALMHFGNLIGFTFWKNRAKVRRLFGSDTIRK